MYFSGTNDFASQQWWNPKLRTTAARLSLDDLRRTMQRFTICALCGLTVHDDGLDIGGDRITHRRCDLGGSDG